MTAGVLVPGDYVSASQGGAEAGLRRPTVHRRSRVGRDS